MTVAEIISYLKKNGSEYNRQGMKRYGINVENAFGISVIHLRKLAKQIGKDHNLAIKLWDTGCHEARHLASMIADPKLVTKSLMNKWVNDFNSWDICDGTCSNLIRKTPFAYEKIFDWCKNKKEFVRRTAFSLIAYLAVHDKKRNDDDFINLFEIIKKYSTDERNFVKKAVNWSLRQIGKRSKYLNQKAIELANEIKLLDSKSARWIANNALRELTDAKVLARIKN
ncbi:DNA alkylation repair protein [Stygiobacter electus]|uniref:DNA alkylation repair protein n=1 Tax=Stygiobacter electus TaxID=3032292 RepID=A0AAE3P025_9BACT|nr:DNA alkylation repair protein [Stygiobacter electus]MDF1611907.1 DNA alkylation repair protein [Stygiobacter electus]